MNGGWVCTRNIASSLQYNRSTTSFSFPACCSRCNVVLKSVSRPLRAVDSFYPASSLPSLSSTKTNLSASSCNGYTSTNMRCSNASKFSPCACMSFSCSMVRMSARELNRVRSLSSVVYSRVPRPLSFIIYSCSLFRLAHTCSVVGIWELSDAGASSNLASPGGGRGPHRAPSADSNRAMV